MSTFGIMGSASGSGGTGDAEVPPPLPPGTTVGGKYLIERAIGAGGNGTVYEATHATIGHRVAIKVVHASLSGRAEVLARFGREARICAALRHPNIGQVYDVGLLDGGTPYMVMELQEGLSLAGIIDQTTLSIAAIVQLAQQLLAGLKCAHDGGVIHRDIKPDNVMVVRDAGGDVVVKLVDFGIAKRIDPLLDGKVTQRGVLVGSPEYMAPEQLRGENVDARTDIYAVGVLLYELITGRTPFHGHTTADLFASILHEQVEPPTQHRSDCPPELQLVVLAALSRDPARRPPTAEEVAHALTLVPLPERASGTTLSELRDRLGLLGGSESDGADTVLRARRAVVRAPAELGLRRPVRSLFDSAPARATIGAALLLVLLPLLIASGNAARQQSAAPPAVEIPARAPGTTREPSSPPVTRPSPAASAPVLPDEAARATETAPPATASRSVPPQARAARASDAVGQEPGSRLRSPEQVRAKQAPAQDERAVPELLNEAATAFVRGDARRARELYLAVLAREPARPEALRGLGLALARMARHAEAVRAFERYLDLRADAPDAARIRELLARARASAQPAP